MRTLTTIILSAVALGAVAGTIDDWSPERALAVAARTAEADEANARIARETGFGARRGETGEPQEPLPAAPSQGPAPKGTRELRVVLVDADGSMPPECVYTAEGFSSTFVDPVIEFGDGPNPQAVTFVVDAARPTDVNLTFSADTPECTPQALVLNFIWPADDVEVVHELTVRPTPTVRIVSAAGAEIPVGFASFCETRFCVQPSALQAGNAYEVGIISQREPHTTAWTQLIAPSGPFEVRFDVERVAATDLQVSAPWGSIERGLVELWRDGELEMAHEYAEPSISISVPPGDYTVRLVGFVGRTVDETNRFAIGEREFTEQFGGFGADVMVDLTEPGGRLAFTGVPADGLQLLLLDEGRPVASVPDLRPGESLLTDLGNVDLRLRGAGFDDVALDIEVSESVSVDLTALAVPPVLLSGVVRDSAGQAQAAAPLYRWAADGIAVDRFETDAAGRFAVPAVRGATLTFGVTEGSDTVAVHHRIFDPSRSAELDVRQRRLPFLDLDETGPVSQRLLGAARDLRIVFVAEGYTAIDETFEDLNGNGVWDGALFLDFNLDGLWQADEPISYYGARSGAEPGTDPRADNEPFDDLNGDGYPNIDDFAVFERNVRDYLRAMLGTPDLQRTGVDIEAFAIFLPSEQAGMDIEGLQERDTRFGAQYRRDSGFIRVDSQEVWDVLEAESLDRGISVVLVNQPVRVGRETSFIVAPGGLGHVSPNSHAPGHELGHVMGLQDEYDERRETSLRSQFPGRHYTHHLDPVLAPWGDGIDRADAPVAVPGTSGLGLYAGARYFSGGVYRSTSDSRMRNLTLDFNAPSRNYFDGSLCLFVEESVPAPAVTGPVPGAEAADRLASYKGCRLEISGPWFDPEQPGHGFFVEQLPGAAPDEPRRINAYWYAFLNGAPVWLVGTGELVGNRATLEMVQTAGGGFPPAFDPGSVTRIPWGTVELTFLSRGRGRVDWASSVEGFGTGSLTLSRLARVADAPEACRSGSYYNPAQDGHGVVVEVLRVAGRFEVFVAWYVYRDGEQLWLVGQAPLVDDRAELVLEQFSGGEFPPEFDAASVARERWGTLTLAFSGPNGARMTWNSELAGFTSGELELVRLTELDDRRCLVQPELP